jgi:hypothetical protein
MILRYSNIKQSWAGVFFRRRSNLLLLLLLLQACAPLLTAAPPPTPQTLIIARPLALESWDNKIDNCATKFPQLAVFIIEDTNPSPITPDITLKLGNLNQSTDNTYLIGNEDLVLAANTAFPVEELSLNQIQDLISTPSTNPPSQDSVIASAQFWTYPAGDVARAAFEQAVLPAGSSPTQAYIAPDPSAMLEALAKNPSALGYLPASVLLQAEPDQKNLIKVLNLNKTLADSLRQPVVATFPATPNQVQTAYAQCLSGSGY